MKKSFLFLVLLYITQIGYSQENFRNGFIIMQNRDTIFGLLNYGESYDNFSSCQFKDNQNLNKTIIFFLPIFPDMDLSMTGISSQEKLRQRRSQRKLFFLRSSSEGWFRYINMKMFILLKKLTADYLNSRTSRLRK